MSSPSPTIRYKRARFLTHLPVDRRYTASHYWLMEEGSGVWRVGLTRFATRMLGDLVEYEFPTEIGASIELGQELGSLEGFKAVTSVYSVLSGEFLGVGDDLRADVTTLEADPYGRGWLYRGRGAAEPASVDVHGYVTILDATIDKMLQSRHSMGEPDDTSG